MIKAVGFIFLNLVFSCVFGQGWQQYRDSLSKYYPNDGEKSIYYGNKLIETLPDTTSKSAYANLYHILGVQYDIFLDFKSAEKYLLKSLALYKESGRSDSSESLFVHQDIASLYWDGFNDFFKAEEHVRIAEELTIKLYGKHSRDYAFVLKTKGVYNEGIGEFGKAEKYYLESLKILSSLLGDSHIQSIQLKQFLGFLYNQMHKYEKAESFLRDTKNLLNSKNLRNHKLYGETNLGLIDFLIKRAEFDSVEMFFSETKHIPFFQKSKFLPGYALLCDKLGEYFLGIDRFDSSEFYLKEAHLIYKEIYSTAHSLYARNAEMLGRLYWRMRNLLEADKFFQIAFTSNQQFLSRFFYGSSEREKETFLKSVMGSRDVYKSFYFKEKINGHALKLSEFSFFEKNLILHYTQALREKFNSDVANKNSSQLKEWLLYKKQLSIWYSRQVNERPAYMDSIEAVANQLEKSLSKSIVAFRSANETPGTITNKLKAALKPTEAAVEISYFQSFDGKNWGDSNHYYAILFKHGVSEPLLIPLFEQQTLQKVFSFKGSSPGFHLVNYLYRHNEFVPKSMYSIIWDPLAKKLDSVRTVYYSPAGILHKINIGAIPVSNRQILAEKHHFIQVSSAAQIADYDFTFLDPTDKIVLYGGIDFNAHTSTVKKNNYNYTVARNANRVASLDIKRYAPVFSYLMATVREVDNIYKLDFRHKYNITVLKGNSATEESFKFLDGGNSPAVIHLATHGFFFPDPGGFKKPNTANENDTIVFSYSENPLIRSGLALAGINNTWKGSLNNNIEDGVLTSYEIALLYLPNTKLAVLSACETGLGDINSSEGVYGLQRAFKVAGVKNLVMSLWKVPDAETAEFMHEFYKNLFDNKDVIVAFKNAQSMMKNKYRNEPYKWAAWVLVR